MPELLQAIRGMNDSLPSQTAAWRKLETMVIQCFEHYAYQEIRMPLLERTALFKRSIGEVTDIIEKEMYTFNDLNGESLTLRPEGTAGCVRACLEHGLLYNQVQKLWYYGPMFRHEKPQKGRYRQFYQFGVEAFGFPGVGIELELIAICKRLWSLLGISDVVHLQLNSLGELTERMAYRQALIAYLKPHYDQLDNDSQRRLESNPLRILDSKNPAMQALIADAPKLIDYLGDSSRKHFDTLCKGLHTLAIPYTINPFLVRGLDYYGHTVFEWVTDRLGSQATICAGGRFDTLVEQLGGHKTPAIGFAMGVERLLLLIETVNKGFIEERYPFIYIIAVGDEAMISALSIAELLRNASTSYTVALNMAGGSFKSQFKKADKSGARLALILGEDELLNNTVSIKPLRDAHEQKSVPQNELINYIQSYLNQGQESQDVCLHD